jgi:hypothetical protein
MDCLWVSVVVDGAQMSTPKSWMEKPWRHNFIYMAKGKNEEGMAEAKQRAQRQYPCDVQQNL